MAVTETDHRTPGDTALTDLAHFLAFQTLCDGRRVEIRALPFAIIDAYQRQGLGPALLGHLTRIARAAGLKELIADVLQENEPMLKVFRRSGLPIRTQLDEDGVVDVALDLP